MTTEGTEIAIVQGTEVAKTTAQIVIEMARDPEVDAEKLAKLIELQWKGEARQARQDYFDALATFQTECPPIPKTKGVYFENKSGAKKLAYKYAPLEEIEPIVRPLLHEHGLSFTWDTHLEGTAATAIARVQHVSGHEERATFTALVEKQAKMNLVQSTASTMTYCRRHALLAALGLTPIDSDMDGRDIDAGDRPTINTSQIAELVSLMEEVFGREEFLTRKARFLKHIGCELSEICVDRYADVIRELEGARS